MKILILNQNKPTFMKFTLISIFAVLLLSCASGKKRAENPDDFTLAFGSCNRTDLPNLLWDDILNTRPDVWVWGGDNIYADTDDMEKLRTMYTEQKHSKGYKELRATTDVIGTWDDHDYGRNDGGAAFKAKAESQQEFLDFMDVPVDSPLRKQEGVYTSKEYVTKNGTVKIIILDTRYFRTPLTPDTETDKRIKPNAYGDGTMLGEAQWAWLDNELKSAKASFTIIVSSVQFLSNQHGFEAWGNFPHEVDRLKRLISDSSAPGVIILSGDRHISEFSRTQLDGMDYPLIDFTSSGLTHAYRNFSGEPNPYRVGEVIFTESFGVLKFDFKAKRVDFEIIGDNGIVLAAMEQRFE